MIRLFCKMGGASIRTQMQHRASFFLESSANFLAAVTDFVGIWAVVSRFHLLGGWMLPEVAILYGIVHMGFGLAEGMARGFDTFGRVMLAGDFDRVLLRPVGTILQVGVRQIQVLKVGRVLQGFLVLALGFYTLGYSLISFEAFLVLLSVLGTFCLFYGLFMIKATLAFWTIETLKVTDVTTYGGREVGQFPMSLFPLAFQLFFTVVIPIACVVYIPVAFVLGKEPISVSLACLAPAAGGFFLFIASRVWHVGVRRYCATGC